MIKLKQLLNEAPMDRRFQRDWEKSSNALINHMEHELKGTKVGRADKVILKNMLQQLKIAKGYPKALAKMVGDN